MTIVRDVFGKGKRLCQEDHLQRSMEPTPGTAHPAFRNDYNPRIAVNVDMIATGTDVKPLEALIFLRDVKSELYFEQNEGQSARTISPDKLREVTPTRMPKTRFVLVDAVGVSESLKSISQPLERNRAIAFAQAD